MVEPTDESNAHLHPSLSAVSLRTATRLPTPRTEVSPPSDQATAPPSTASDRLHSSTASPPRLSRTSTPQPGVPSSSDVVQPSGVPDQPSTGADQPRPRPPQIPTRGGTAPAYPTAPSSNLLATASASLGWLTTIMSRKPPIPTSPKPARAVIKPSTSDLSAAGQSSFVNASSRVETGSLQPPANLRNERTMITPSISISSMPPSSPSNEAVKVVSTSDEMPLTQYLFPTVDTGLSIPSTAVPSMPSETFTATSDGISRLESDVEAEEDMDGTEQDPDETVSESFFHHPVRRYRSDADQVGRDEAGPSRSNQAGPDVHGSDEDDQVDANETDFAEEDELDVTSPIYTESMNSTLDLEIIIMAENRAARLARLRDIPEETSPKVVNKQLSVHFEVKKQPVSWTQKIAKLFSREERVTPDLELGVERVPTHLKGKGRAEPRNSLFGRKKRRPITENFLDMGSDHSPILAGLTRKLSFRSPKTESKVALGDCDLEDPFERQVPTTKSTRSTTPKEGRMSSAIGAATRALTIKRDRATTPHPPDPNLTKAESVLGANLGPYKTTTQSNPNLLMPIPRSHAMTTPRPNSMVGVHPFSQLPPKETLADTAEQVGRDFGRWVRGLGRPGIGDGTRRSSWASGQRNSSGNSQTVARLERLVSTASSQLEPQAQSASRPHSPVTLYPNGITPENDPEMYEHMVKFLQQRAGERRRETPAESRERVLKWEQEQRMQEMDEISQAFPLPPTPRPQPTPGPRQSSLRSPMSPAVHLNYDSPAVAPLSPLEYLSPSRITDQMPSPGLQRATAPHALGPVRPENISPRPHFADGPLPIPPTQSHPSSRPPVVPVVVPATPNALGLSTAPSTSSRASSSRVSFAPSPPHYSHMDLKSFLMTSPSQITRTTSATEPHTPDSDPLIPEFPAGYAELAPYVVYENDVWLRVQDQWSNDEIASKWEYSTPRYTWKMYRMLLTSGFREITMEDTYEMPADMDTAACIHLFDSLQTPTPWISHASILGSAQGSSRWGLPISARPALINIPEVHRRVLSAQEKVSTFQPYTTPTRPSSGRQWKEEDEEIDVTMIRFNARDVWYLQLKDLEEFVRFHRAFGIAKDCLMRGCGAAFRERLAKGSYSNKERYTPLRQEYQAALFRWDTRCLAVEEESPASSPIKPAAKLPIAVPPSRGILKRSSSTGNVRSNAHMISPVSGHEGYLAELDAWRIAGELSDELRGRTSRERTETGQTVRQSDFPPQIDASGPPRRHLATSTASMPTPTLNKSPLRSYEEDEGLVFRSRRSTDRIRQSHTLRSRPSEASDSGTQDPTPALSTQDLASESEGEVLSPPDRFATLPYRIKRDKNDVENSRSDPVNHGLGDFVDGYFRCPSAAADYADPHHITVADPPPPSPDTSPQMPATSIASPGLSSLGHIDLDRLPAGMITVTLPLERAHSLEKRPTSTGSDSRDREAGTAFADDVLPEPKDPEVFQTYDEGRRHFMALRRAASGQPGVGSTLHRVISSPVLSSSEASWGPAVPHRAESGVNTTAENHSKISSTKNKGKRRAKQEVNATPEKYSENSSTKDKGKRRADVGCKGNSNAVGDQGKVGNTASSKRRMDAIHKAPKAAVKAKSKQYRSKKSGTQDQDTFNQSKSEGVAETLLASPESRSPNRAAGCTLRLTLGTRHPQAEPVPAVATDDADIPLALQRNRLPARDKGKSRAVGEGLGIQIETVDANMPIGEKETITVKAPEKADSKRAGTDRSIVARHAKPSDDRKENTAPETPHQTRSKTKTKQSATPEEASNGRMPQSKPEEPIHHTRSKGSPPLEPTEAIDNPSTKRSRTVMKDQTPRNVFTPNMTTPVLSAPPTCTADTLCDETPGPSFLIATPLHHRSTGASTSRIIPLKDRQQVTPSRSRVDEEQENLDLGTGISISKGAGNASGPPSPRRKHTGSTSGAYTSEELQLILDGDFDLLRPSPNCQ